MSGGRTVQDLLEDALYLSKSDREFSPVEPGGSDINTALQQFILLLDAYRLQVPYWTEKFLNDESELENINASKINYVNYLLGTTVQPLRRFNQQEFSEFATVLDLRGVPQGFWFDEANNKIQVYPLPESASRRFQIGFTPLIVVSSLQQKLPSSLTLFSQLFLQYELAANLCAIYNIPWSPLKETFRKQYYSKLIMNANQRLTQPLKTPWGTRQHTVPWLAYISGNTP